MRFLADESCDFAVVRSLRAAGHDVLAVGEFQHRSVDSELIQLALRESRVLLTEDKDFGWLTFAAPMEGASPGIVLIRYPASARAELGSAVEKLVDKYGQQLAGAFVVVQPGYVRFSRYAR